MSGEPSNVAISLDPLTSGISGTAHPLSAAGPYLRPSPSVNSTLCAHTYLFCCVPVGHSEELFAHPQLRGSKGREGPEGTETSIIVASCVGSYIARGPAPLPALCSHLHRQSDSKPVTGFHQKHRGKLLWEKDGSTKEISVPNGYFHAVHVGSQPQWFFFSFIHFKGLVHAPSPQ